MKYPCIKLDDLQQAFHQIFNSAQSQQVSIQLLDEMLLKSIREQLKFSKEKFRNTIHKCNNFSTPSSDKISQRHLEVILNDNKYLSNSINIVNIYINLGQWLLYFKISILIIIPKLNKVLYHFPKMFRPIVFLNMLGELIKKVIGKRL